MINQFLCLATPIPVHISDTIRTAAETDWPLFYMALGGTIASAAVALFTGFLAMKTNTLAGETKRMADKTADLAKETLDSVNIARISSVIADQHHQESQSPILILLGIRFEPARRQMTEEPATITLDYGVRNIGFGPALEADITMEFEHGRIKSMQESIGDVGPGETRPVGERVYSSDLRFLYHNYSEIPWRTSVITISVQYRSVFGGVRTTQYAYEYIHDADAILARFPYVLIGTTISPQTIVTRTVDPPTGILMERQQP